MQLGHIFLAGIGTYVLCCIAAKAFRRGAPKSDGAPASSPDELAPDVADSSVWSSSRPELPDFQEALNVVLDVGEALLRCSVCQSPATQSSFGDWSLKDGEVFAEVLEKCPECNSELTFHVNAGLFIAFTAIQALEQTRAALALGLSMDGADTLDKDLRELDGE